LTLILVALLVLGMAVLFAGSITGGRTLKILHH